MIITLDPPTDTNDVGDNHTVTATITDQNDIPQEGIEVEFSVISGPNTGTAGTCSPGTCLTDTNGEVDFTYTGDGGPGTDVIQACYTNDADQEICSQTVTKVWNAVVTYDIDLTPPYDLNLVGQDHTVTAAVTDDQIPPNPQQDVMVTFTVISGPNTGATGTCIPGTCETDTNGEVDFTYTGNGGVGKDHIQACFDAGQDTICSEVVEKEWTEEVIALTPLLAQNPTGTNHTVTATVQDLKGNLLSGIPVTFTVVSGPHAGTAGICVPASCQTDATGEVDFTYLGSTQGTDAIQACFTNAAGQEVCTDYDGRVGNDAIKEWDDPCPLIEPLPDELSDGIIGEFYSQTFTGFGGTAPYTVTHTGGTLPPGLTFASGVLSGTPTQDGTYTFTISVTDDDDCPGSREMTIQICPGITLNPVGGPLPGGKVGEPYSQTISASTEPAVFQLIGELPPGLSGHEGSYIIDGIPTQAGTWEFTIIAEVPFGCFTSGAYRIRIIEETQAVPTNSQWGMMILALGLAVFSVMLIRRRRVSP